MERDGGYMKIICYRAKRGTLWNRLIGWLERSAVSHVEMVEYESDDNGQRRFILCSSTEANDKEPAKNLCRDVCAERMRRVMQGYGGKEGHSLQQGGEFAYLQLDKLDAADVALDATADHATSLSSSVA